MLIMKSISDTEVATFLKIIKPYYNYLINHPNSLITKVFGLFTIQFEGFSKKVNVILMENISKTPIQ